MISPPTSRRRAARGAGEAAAHGARQERLLPRPAGVDAAAADDEAVARRGAVEPLGQAVDGRRVGRGQQLAVAGVAAEHDRVGARRTPSPGRVRRWMVVHEHRSTGDRAA
jgi:hypothetical protein